MSCHEVIYEFILLKYEQIEKCKYEPTMKRVTLVFGFRQLPKDSECEFYGQHQHITHLCIINLLLKLVLPPRLCHDKYNNIKLMEVHENHGHNL